MRALFATLLAMLLLGSSGTSATAQPGMGRRGPPGPGGGPPPHFGPPPGGSRLEHALEGVDLPEDVRADVDALLDDAHRERRNLHRSLRTAHDRMRELLEAGEPDEAAILAQADEIGGLRTALDKNRLVTLLRVRARLSPEQREALTQALESRKHPPRGRDRPE